MIPLHSELPFNDQLLSLDHEQKQEASSAAAAAQAAAATMAPGGSWGDEDDQFDAGVGGGVGGVGGVGAAERRHRVRVIVATDAAESSITFPNVDHVSVFFSK